MNSRRKLLPRTLMLLASVFFILASAEAANKNDTFDVQQTISDGKNNRAFGKWVQQIQNRPVKSVVIGLSKRSGGNDTFVNLRYQGKQTFENGKRVHLYNAEKQKFTWNLNGQRPSGSPLVLNAYNGEVFVHKVKVNYADVTSSTAEKNNNNSPVASTEENEDAQRLCRNAKIKRPRIELGEVKSSGGLFSGKYKFDGSVYGACIEEAGYFENGRLKDEIEIPLSDRYQRKEFRVKVRSGRKGQIRVYTTNGREDVIDVDEEIKREGLL